MRALVSLLCFLLFGCLDGPDTSDVDRERLSDVIGIGRARIDHAVSALPDHAYENRRRILVTELSGDPILEYDYSTRFSGPRGARVATVLDTSMTGSGQSTVWKDYLLHATTEDSLEWGPKLLPEDPLVLSRQGPGYYRYTDLPDTTFGEVPVRRVRADLVSGTDRQGVQGGTFYFDDAARELVGFDLDVANRSLLFDEVSRFRYLLGPTAHDEWLPSTVDVETVLDLPLSKGQRFELRGSYTVDDSGIDESEASR